MYDISTLSMIETQTMDTFQDILSVCNLYKRYSILDILAESTAYNSNHLRMPMYVFRKTNVLVGGIGV